MFFMTSLAFLVLIPLYQRFAGGVSTAEPAFWDCSHGPSVQPLSPLLAQFSHMDAATACFELLFARFLLVTQSREPRHLHLDMKYPPLLLQIGGVFSVDLWAKCDPDLSPPDSDRLKTLCSMLILDHVTSGTSPLFPSSSITSVVDWLFRIYESEL